MRDVIVNKRMASAFHETNLAVGVQSATASTRVVVTGGSTSGCVRATVVDSLSRGYRDDRSRGVRRRQAREPAFREPLRHGRSSTPT